MRWPPLRPLSRMRGHRLRLKCSNRASASVWGEGGAGELSGRIRSGQSRAEQARAEQDSWHYPVGTQCKGLLPVMPRCQGTHLPRGRRPLPALPAGAQTPAAPGG